MRKAILLSTATVATFACAATLAVATNTHHAAGSDGSRALPGLLANARLATAAYATSLDAARAAGYQNLTPMVADMGIHVINPTITGFDVTKPPILVYEKHGGGWQLGALE